MQTFAAICWGLPWRKLNVHELARTMMEMQQEESLLNCQRDPRKKIIDDAANLDSLQKIIHTPTLVAKTK